MSKFENFKGKVRTLKENLETWIDIIKDHPKKCIAAIFLAATLIFGSVWTVINRVPPAVSCLWSAKLTYSLSGEDWRYQWIVNECQRKRKDGMWVGLNSAKDAAGVDVE